MSEGAYEIPQATFRLMALEAIVMDIVARDLFGKDDPRAAAAAYRERMRNLLTASLLPNLSDVPALQAYAHGEMSDAVDVFCEKVEGTVRQWLQAKPSRPR